MRFLPVGIFLRILTLIRLVAMKQAHYDRYYDGQDDYGDSYSKKLKGHITGLRQMIPADIAMLMNLGIAIDNMTYLERSVWNLFDLSWPSCYSIMFLECRFDHYINYWSPDT